MRLKGKGGPFEEQPMKCSSNPSEIVGGGGGGGGFYKDRWLR